MTGTQSDRMTKNEVKITRYFPFQEKCVTLNDYISG